MEGRLGDLQAHSGVLTAAEMGQVHAGTAPAGVLCGLRHVRCGDGHEEPSQFSTDDAVVKLIWLAIADIEDKRAQVREKDRGKPANKCTAPGRHIEGHATQLLEASHERPVHGVRRPYRRTHPPR